MLKSNESINKLERDALELLRSQLSQVPIIRLLGIEYNVRGVVMDIDIVMNLDVFGKRHTLACEVKSSGQPRYVRQAILQLHDFMARNNQSVIPVLIAPYLSQDAQALCREQGVSFFDFEGNAYLFFDNIFIEKQVTNKPAADRRELRSLFKPKSAQVLRIMLRNPNKTWLVTELAKAANVSVGHISNVRVGLLDREWAKVTDKGIYLSEPDALLDAWRDDYVPPAGKRMSFYTALHGNQFEEASRRVLSSNDNDGLAMFASFSAAQWYAPYGRTGAQYFYANQVGLERLQSALNLSSVSKGENVVITVLKDLDFLRDSEEPAPGVICTDLIQTYLDLANAGERGRESADHLRREKLTWLK